MYIFFVSFRGQKCLGHAQIGLLQGFNSKFPTSISTHFICGVPPLGGLTVLKLIKLTHEQGWVLDNQIKFSVQFYFLQSLPVYSGPVCSVHPVHHSHQTTSQNFQLSYIFCKVDQCIAALDIAFTLYIIVTRQLPKIFSCLTLFFCKVDLYIQRSPCIITITLPRVTVVHRFNCIQHHMQKGTCQFGRTWTGRSFKVHPDDNSHHYYDWDTKKNQKATMRFQQSLSRELVNIGCKKKKNYYHIYSQDINVSLGHRFSVLQQFYNSKITFTTYNKMNLQIGCLNKFR